ncbi:MAG TPA: DUF5615 family PIN-like protein [Phycisphaerales bacterium]|nr:DUF5615 family PIN-like protein [Phycisphaerales bacterium]
MRLLLDQGLARSCVHYLCVAGHDAVHVSQVGRHESSDESLVEFAASESRCIVTLDADFHALLAVSRRAFPSVVWVRIEGLKGPEMSEVVRGVLADCQFDLASGALVTVYPTEARVRRLPIGDKR